MLWEIAFALWGSCIDGIYSFPLGMKQIILKGNQKVQVSKDHPCLFSRCVENPSGWKLANCEWFE